MGDVKNYNEAVLNMQKIPKRTLKAFR